MGSNKLFKECMMDHWFPVEWSHKVRKKPRGIVLNGTPLVLFRANRDIQVLSDRCPHRGAPLSKGSVKEGCITCPYHGWRFDGNGTCRLIPGLNCYSSKEIHRAQAYKAEEKYGLIWVCLNTEAKCNIPDISIKKNEKNFHFTTLVQSSLKDVVENALDPLHTHFIHSGLIRSDGERKPINIKMHIDKDRIQATYCNEVKQQGWIYKILSFGHQVDKSFGRFIHPSLFQIEFETIGKRRLLINGFLSPINEECSKIFLISSTDVFIPNYIFKIFVKPLFVLAMKQDKKILEIKAKHQQACGVGKEVSTEGDLFGPYLDLLLQGKELVKKEYEVELYV